MLSMYLFENKFPGYTKKENTYCEPYRATNWRSLEEAFGGCSSSSSCEAFFKGCDGKYYYCASIATTGSDRCTTLYTQTGKNFLERQNFSYWNMCV